MYNSFGLFFDGREVLVWWIGGRFIRGLFIVGIKEFFGIEFILKEDRRELRNLDLRITI